MAYGSKSAKIPCFYLCYEETFLYFQHKKVTSEKQKLRPFLGIFLENPHASNCVKLGLDLYDFVARTVTN